MKSKIIGAFAQVRLDFYQLALEKQRGDADKEEETMRKAVQLAIVFLFVLSIGLGCSSYSKTVRTETVEYPAESGRYSDDRPGEPVVVERRTGETTEIRDNSGLLSGTVNVLGEALALPFHFVGGLISVLF